MVEIQLADEDDVPRIVELSNRAAEVGTANFATEPEPLAEWQAAFVATHASHPWLVACDEGGVIGFAKASPHRARGAYRFSVELSVYLDEARQGAGIGTALYAALIASVRAQGYRTLIAGITVGHAASERLHARFGFVRCGTLHRVGWKHDAWHDVGYWQLQLRPAGDPPRPLRRVADVPLIRREPLDAAPSRALLAALDEEVSAAYPEPGATHVRLDQDEVGGGRGAFLVASLQGERVGCGAIRRLDETTAELKRMFVRPGDRGRGIGDALLAALEMEARLLGVRRLVLETGARLGEALALYRRRGFRPIPSFGEYVGSPLSVCLEKPIERA